MLVIRLTRVGRKGEAKYRVVVKEKRSKRDGASIDTIGSFEKISNSKVIKNIDDKKLSMWISRGAQLSQGAEKMLSYK